MRNAYRFTFFDILNHTLSYRGRNAREQVDHTGWSNEGEKGDGLPTETAVKRQVEKRTRCRGRREEVRLDKG